MAKFSAILLLVFLLTNCASFRSTDRLTLTFTGPFTTKRGVQDSLSCFCATGGYLDACAGGVIALCFEGDAPAGDCPQLEVWGYFVERRPPVGAAATCPDGLFRFLMVERWSCRGEKPGRAVP